MMLSLLPHIRHLDIARTASGQLPLDALPVGFVVETAKIVQVVQEQCVYIDTGVAGVKGFAHVCHFEEASNSRSLAFQIKDLILSPQVQVHSKSHQFIAEG